MTHIKALKEKLQFTGWLQYILTAVLATVVLFVALIIWALINLIVAAPIFFLAIILYVDVVIEIITIKFKFRMKEALPKRNDGLNLFDLMRARHSCRSFQLRKMRNEDYDELINHVQLELNQVNMNSDVKDRIRFEYVSEPLTVWPVVNASEFIVAIAPKEYSRNAVINVGRSLQKIVMHATRMGVATCWIGPGADQTSITKQMGQRFDKNRDHIVCVCAVGYASKYIPLSIRLMSKSQKHRLPISDLFFKNNQLTEPLKIDEKEFQNFGRCYEICQWSPSSFNAQPTRAVVNISDSNEVIVNFYCTTKSRFYGPLALGIWCGNWEMGCEALGIQGNVFYNFYYSSDVEGEQMVPQYDVSWKSDKIWKVND
jgi:nitroreductase